MELTKEYFDQAITGLATKDDLVAEIRPLKAQLTSIENKVDRLAVRTSEDDVATMKDVEQLVGRIKRLETQVRKLKLQNAA
jgi:polyhydroxyalkanoate synthesis regulator phasin